MLLNELFTTETTDSVVFTFGRMQPPTSGHARVFQRITEVAKQQRADHVVYLSHVNNPDTDPLLWEDKCAIVGQLFPGIILSESREIKTPFHALAHLCNLYENITFVVGSDRVDEFRKMEKYAILWGAHTFNIVESGTRDSSVSEVSGVSATLARQYARENDMANFRNVMPEALTEEYASVILGKIRTGMGLTGEL